MGCEERWMKLLELNENGVKFYINPELITKIETNQQLRNKVKIYLACGSIVNVTGNIKEVANAILAS
jgi:uncharacterized protein YlzI (FlbEa/FlbD family)